MALTRTLAQLRTEIRDRGEIRSVYVDDTELTRAINVAYSDFYCFLVDTNPDWYLSSGTITVVSGTDEYDLNTMASDFWKVVGVDVREGGRWYKMEPFNFGSRNEYQNSGLNARNARYRIMGSNLRVSPNPSWGGSIRVWYVPAPTLLSADGDTVDGVAGWEEYIVLHTLIQYAAKEESDPSVFAAQLAAIKDQVRALAMNRDDGEADRVRDIWTESFYNTYRYGYPKLGLP